MNHTDALTILRCCSPHVATKTHHFTKDGWRTEAFDAGILFDCRLLPAANIFDISSKLKAIESIDHVFAIRGLPLPHVVLSTPHHRRKHNPCGNYLSPAAGHYYFMVDIDKLPLPDGLLLTPDNVRKVVDFVIATLPDEFHNISFHWQLSSSAGLYDQTKVSIHLWFWSDRKLTDDELKRWGKAVNKAKGFPLIDLRMFNDVQPHYTAAPIFDGMVDPFPERSGLIEKASHEVALVLPAEQPLPPRPLKQKGTCTRTSKQTRGSSGHGFEHKLSLIGDHGGGEGFHGPIISAIASYVATAGRDNVNREWLLETVRNRVLAADSTQHDPSYIDIKASREYLMPAIDGALEKFGDAVKKRSRVTHGVKPHFRRSHTTIVAARKRVSKILKRIF